MAVVVVRLGRTAVFGNYAIPITSACQGVSAFLQERRLRLMDSVGVQETVVQNVRRAGPRYYMQC